MGTILSSRKELRDTILVSLRKLIDSATKNSELSNDKEQLAYFAKNFLPICLNLYTNPAHGTDEQATRFSALETIKVMNHNLHPIKKFNLFFYLLVDLFNNIR